MAAETPMWKLKEQHVPLYAYHDSIFTDAEIDQIVEIGKQTQMTDASILSTREGQVNSDYRTCKTSWLYPAPTTSWIFEKLTAGFELLNNKFYNYDLTQFEPLQFTSYASDRAEFYGRHTDCVFGRNDMTASRKLSVTLQLSDPADYAGGDLLLHVGPAGDVMPKQKGMMILFPSYMLHEVTPVTAGTRYSLVTWAHGPLFR